MDATEIVHTVRWILLSALAASIWGGPIFLRMVGPIPSADRKDIEDFLSARGQTLVSLRRLLFGGPWRSTGRIPYQCGRPYRVMGREADGSLWAHTVATGVPSAPVGSRLSERIQETWRPVLG